MKKWSNFYRNHQTTLPSLKGADFLNSLMSLKAQEIQASPKKRRREQSIKEFGTEIRGVYLI